MQFMQFAAGNVANVEVDFTPENLSLMSGP